MKIRKWMIVVAGLLVIFSAVWSSIERRKMVAQTSSRYVVLMERFDQKIIASKRAEKKMYPASMTKIMTTLVALEQITDEEKTVEMPNEIVAAAKNQGASTAGFSGGDTVTIRDLLYGIMLPSGAECCYRIGKYLDGSEQKFVEQMNRKAEELGMKHTHFSNMTGLHAEDHYTTAKDMALLLDHALKNKRFRKIFTSMTYRTSPGKVFPSGRILYSTLFQYRDQLKLNNGDYLGGKTGYTSEAGLCLASFAKVNGKEYVLITAGADGDHETKPYHVMDAGKIFQRLSETAEK